MKKLAILAVASLGVITANAQQLAYQPTNFGSNWSIGFDGGVATPMTGSAFFGSMRGTAGMHIEKQITPTFGMGVEGVFGVNTSSWGNNIGYRSSTAFDNSYVGAYGTVSLFNLFGGNYCGTRPFDIQAVAGAGWGHNYWNKAKGEDWNYFATRVGLNFNFNAGEHVTIALKPSITWDMSDGGAAQSSASYDIHRAAFNLQAGVSYKFGPGFVCVESFDPAQIAALNATVNDLRAEVDATAAALAVSTAANADLTAQLQACQNRPTQTTVVRETKTETTTTLNSVRYVFFRNASSVITADQMPNVEMIAAYLKNHPDATVEIKGYASPDGNLEFNERLAQARAESVQKALVNKYKIAADRITAKGEGIGHMFDEESWNRVSICTIDGGTTTTK